MTVQRSGGFRRHDAMPAGVGTADKLLQELVDCEQRSSEGPDLPADYDVFEFRRSNGVSPPVSRQCGTLTIARALRSQHAREVHLRANRSATLARVRAQVLAKARYNARGMVADLRN